MIYAVDLNEENCPKKWTLSIITSLRFIIQLYMYTNKYNYMEKFCGMLKIN